jgi:hypothetical protein
MKVTLTKEIKLQSATVYLKLEREVERKDIQEYLCGKTFPNEVVERRVKDYLKNVHIFDELYHLTSDGQRAKEIGMVRVREEGKYQIWYTQNDSFFGSKIFYFKRLQPQPRGNVENHPLQINKENYCLPVAQNGFLRFVLLSDINQVEQMKSSSSSISFTWKWNDLDNSVQAFSGQIAGDRIADDTEFKDSKNLKQKISEILPEWDSINERYKIHLNAVKDNDIVSFECLYQGKWHDFDVHIGDLPIEPYNEEEALQWRNRLLDKELEQGYMHPKDFESMASSLNRKDGFKVYAASLDIPKASEYRTKLLPSKKSETGPAYWHLSAPQDLSPDIPKERIAQSFSLQKDQEISFRQITKKIWTSSVDKVFYYDKYVIDEQQQQKANALFSVFNYKKAYLITNITDNKRSDYIEKHNSQITQKNLKDIFKNTKPQHDRYLILSHDSQLEVWDITNSMDFIKFNNNDITADTKGIIEQSVVFNNVGPEMLHKELRQFIEDTK